MLFLGWDFEQAVPPGDGCIVRFVEGKSDKYPRPEYQITSTSTTHMYIHTHTTPDIEIHSYPIFQHPISSSTFDMLFGKNVKFIFNMTLWASFMLSLTSSHRSVVTETESTLKSERESVNLWNPSIPPRRQMNYSKLSLFSSLNRLSFQMLSLWASRPSLHCL